MKRRSRGLPPKIRFPTLASSRSRRTGLQLVGRSSLGSLRVVNLSPPEQVR